MLTQGKGTRDKQRTYLLSDINLFETVSKGINKLGLTYASLRDLVVINSHYKTHSIGITASGIISRLGHSEGTYPAMFYRLSLLQTKGLIENLDRRYIPTDKAIQLLNSIKV
jgi:hypothetical protein